MDLIETFNETTDGVDSPRSVYSSSEEFIALNKKIGLKCSYLGTAISIFEMSLLSKRFDVIR